MNIGGINSFGRILPGTRRPGFQGTAPGIPGRRAKIGRAGCGRTGWLKILSVLVLIAGILVAGSLAGCSRGKGEQAAVSGPDTGTLEVSICMEVPHEDDLPESLIWRGIRHAHDLNGTLAGRKIELVLRETGSRTFDSLEAIADFVREEEISGPILFRSSRAFGPEGGFSRDSGAFITVMPSAQCLLQEGLDCTAVQLGSSLKDRARASALFARNSLEASDAMIVLDQDAPGSVLLASRFSSEMIALGGTVSELCILSGDTTDLQDALGAVKQKNPGVIYLPYAEKTTISAIRTLRRQNPESPVVVVNVPQEQRFLVQGGDDLDGVYLVTDFRLRLTRGERILSWIRQTAGRPESEVTREPLAALGGDAYLVLMDLLREGLRDEGPGEAASAPEEGGPSPDSEGFQLPDALHKRIHVYHVDTGVLQGPHLKYLESIEP